MRFDDIKCEFLLNNRWIDLNQYRLQPAGIRASVGIRDAHPLSRVASTGKLSLTLINTDNQFTPCHPNCMAGFHGGMYFRLRVSAEGRVRTRFYGRVAVNGISIQTNNKLVVTKIEVLDYMQQLATHQLNLPAYATDKRLEEVVELIIDNMPVKPLSTSYGTGRSTFAFVFDTISEKTRGLTEVSKATLSELGYVYTKQTDARDEVLVVENRGYRSGKPLASVNVSTFDSDTRVTQDNDIRITQDGSVRVTQHSFSQADAVFIDAHKTAAIDHAKHYFNQVTTKAYPRRIDTQNVALFVLDRALSIGAEETITLKGSFRDPDQLAVSVAALSTVDPVSGTDYLGNTAEDNTGTDITADLTVTAVYGTNGVDYTITNNGTTAGFVTHLQARGRGIYTYRMIENVEADDGFILYEGTIDLGVDMQYQDNPLVTKDIAIGLLDKHRQKLTSITKITFIANRDETESEYPDLLASAFLDLNVGDKIRIVDRTVGIENDYFIQGLDFDIAQGDVISFSYTLKEAIYETYEAWILDSATQSQLGQTTILGY